MEADIYVEGQRLDQFESEKIQINLSVKNINDIGKIFTDFTQTINFPSTPINDAVFTHWYDADVDGTFNANKRASSYLEVNTLPFRFGSFQLIDAKLKNGLPYSYSGTFFSAGVNLSDLFGDDQLSSLDFSELNHAYNSDTVTDAMHLPTIANGNVYYPLISGVDEMSLGTAGVRDLINEDNEISYMEFKPGIRDYEIIKAIEAKYNVTFSRDFFDRSVFYNKFFWLNKDSGYMKAFGQRTLVDITSAGNLNEIDITANTATDTVSYTAIDGEDTRKILFKVNPSAGFENIPYKVTITNNGNDRVFNETVGTATTVFSEGADGEVMNLQFFVSSSGDFQFTTRILGRRNFPLGHVDRAANTAEQIIEGMVVVSEQMPTMKVMEYFQSIVKEFNLIIRPITGTSFYIDTLDNWYSKGKAYDITKFVDIKDIGVKRTEIKKEISFNYQPTDAILGQKYFQNNGIGYGDLKAKFDVSGDELKIESQFENMLFERLQDETTGDLSDIQAGYSIDIDLKPYKGKPISFYRNGYTDIDTPLIIQPSGSLTRIWHTATEDNVQQSQVTNSLNFGSDVSSYFYAPIERGLYFNFWKTYIEDLFNRKTRVYSIKANLPIGILYNIELNDRFVIKDKKYKISNITIDLTTGDATLDLFTDLSAPLDSIANVIPITVDSTEYTVDSELLTVDMVSIHDPVTSYTINGISRSQYLATSSEEYFEVKISANTNWTVSKIDSGDGVSWFSSDKVTGVRSDYIRVKVNISSGSARSGILRITIGATNFDLTITQAI